jgi:hypothetical protein
MVVQARHRWPPSAECRPETSGAVDELSASAYRGRTPASSRARSSCASCRLLLSVPSFIPPLTAVYARSFATQFGWAVPRVTCSGFCRTRDSLYCFGCTEAPRRHNNAIPVSRGRSQNNVEVVEPVNGSLIPLLSASRIISFSPSLTQAYTPSCMSRKTFSGFWQH